MMLYDIVLPRSAVLYKQGDFLIFGDQAHGTLLIVEYCTLL
jgi:hypothetical protein